MISHRGQSPYHIPWVHVQYVHIDTKSMDPPLLRSLPTQRYQTSYSFLSKYIVQFWCCILHIHDNSIFSNNTFYQYSLFRFSSFLKQFMSFSNSNLNQFHFKFPFVPMFQVFNAKPPCGFTHLKHSASLIQVHLHRELGLYARLMSTFIGSARNCPASPNFGIFNSPITWNNKCDFIVPRSILQCASNIILPVKSLTYSNYFKNSSALKILNHDLSSRSITFLITSELALRSQATRAPSINGVAR